MTRSTFPKLITSCCLFVSFFFSIFHICLILFLELMQALSWPGFCFFFFFFKLYKIVLVLPNIKINPPQVYMCSPSWTLLPPPSPYHPSGSSQCTSPKHPISCLEPGLATRFIYDILHVSMPFSQIFPPSPSPTFSIWCLDLRHYKRYLKWLKLKN